MLEKRDQMIKFDGYIKAITDDSPTPSAESDVPVKEGVIIQWWISGFGEGESIVLGFSTEQAHYYINAPSPAYAKYFKNIKERAVLSKAVVDILINAHDEGDDLEYEELLTKLEKIPVDDDMDTLTSEMLIHNSQFVLAQVSSFEEAGDEDEERYMMNSKCIRELLDLAGVENKKSSNQGHVRRNKQTTKKKSKTTQSLATTTPLIREVFTEYFGAQIDTNENVKTKTIRKWKCKFCENCMKDDCGSCKNCLDMTKFGGTGKSKQGCIQRVCQNMIEKNMENEVSDDENEVQKENIDKNIIVKGKHQLKKFFLDIKRMDISSDIMHSQLGVKYPGEPLGQIKSKSIYNVAQVAGKMWKSGDFAMVEREVVQIVYFFQKGERRHKAHVKNFVKGSETVLEETCDAKQLFEVDTCSKEYKACSTISTTSLDSPVDVKFWPIPEDWAMEGGKGISHDPPIDSKNPKSFYYRQKYTHKTARFEDAHPLKIDFLKKNTEIRLY